MRLSSTPRAIAASPDGARLAIALGDARILLVAPSLAVLGDISTQAPVSDVAWLDETLLASAEADRVVVRDVASDRTRETLHLPPSHGLRLAASRAHAYLVTLPIHEPAVPATVFRWEPPRTRQIRALDESVRALAVDRPRARVIAATLRRIVAFPIVRDRLGPPESIAAVAESGEPASIAVAPDGALAVGTTRGAVILIERNAEPRVILEGDASRDALFGLAFDRSGDIVLAGDRAGKIRRWRRSRGAAMPELTSHRGILAGLALSSDGARLASASLDGSVRTWDAQSGERRGAIQLPRARACDVAFAPDGSRLAVGDDLGWVRLYGPDLRQLAIFRAHRDRIRRIAWSPSGLSLATSSDDRTVRIFSLDPARLERIVRADTVPTTLAFAPSGQHLIFHDANQLVWLRVDPPFDVRNPAELLHLAQARAGMRLQGLALVPFDFAQDRPFDSAQGRPLDGR